MVCLRYFLLFIVLLAMMEIITAVFFILGEESDLLSISLFIDELATILNGMICAL
jgi:hypothetical protein